MLCLSGFELYSRWVPLIFTRSFLVSCLGLLNGVANNHFAFFVVVGDMAQERDAVYYPQEMLDLNWNTTSKEKIQEVYKVWAGDYDKVCFDFSCKMTSQERLQKCNTDDESLPGRSEKCF